jgi:hypothetical protein
MTDRCTAMLNMLKNKKIYEIMKVVQVSKKHPALALTDGAYEILLKYIVDLEQGVQ